LPAWSTTAFAATATLGTLTQFLFGDLAVAVFVSALHAFPCLGRHFILSDEAVAVLVERLEVWTLATFATFAAGTLSRTARSALSARTIRRWDWWAARWGLNCHRSGCE
jgi:3-oxoacyl-[acyl-carrier-protein] synthase III